MLPILAGSLALVCALLRRWRIAAFFVALAVDGDVSCDDTRRAFAPSASAGLESLPVNAGYPSGHTAAAIAVYCGLALLVSSRIDNPAARVLAWTGAASVVIFVALARMYRGMHHPLDVAGGIVVGIVAVIVLVFACRVAGAAAEARDRSRSRGRTAR